MQLPLVTPDGEQVTAMPNGCGRDAAEMDQVMDTISSMEVNK